MIKAKGIKRYLILAMLALSVIPLVASYLLLEEVLNSAVSLVVKPQTAQLLESYREDLKHLRQLDPGNESEYKSRFLAASDELAVYQQPQLLRQVLTDTYRSYYLVLFVVILAFALVIAVWLSGKVARAYRQLSQQDVEKAQKIQALSHFDQWQVIAAKLAHEINNPLTPIQMMVSNLPRNYAVIDKTEFKQMLHDADAVVSEEVAKLKAMVSHFSQFSKLPEPQLKKQNLFARIEEFVRLQQANWPSIEFSLDNQIDNEADAEVLLDHLLFNQCLFNLINNAQQANPTLALMRLTITVSLQQQQLNVALFNQGKAIDQALCSSLFDLYYSTNSHKENMGLGLSIVRKIMLDHGGDIECQPHADGALFVMSFPTTLEKK